MENKEILKIAKKVKKDLKGKTTLLCALASAGAVIGTMLFSKAVKADA
ncbi:MAG: hypothetical protein J6C16_02465 [Clostridia bacterium]|nr:hypothetical protein [Clostridia bacterium]